MLRILFSILLLSSLNQAVAQYNCQQTKLMIGAATSTPPINNNAKSDTLDILHYDLDMDMTNVQSQFIRLTAELTMVCKMNNINQVNLDFLNLHVDSVKLNDTLDCSYNFSSGPEFPIFLPDTFNLNDTFKIAVHYYGFPVKDASGWGGFHFNSPYFYNLGVGFAANPHTFGRAWFPCFDNFVEKSTYSFHVKTANGRLGYCNGMRTLLDTTTFGGDTVVSHWEQTDPIPTYLASVAISNYEELWSNHAGMPFVIVARPVDTANAKGSFQNFHNIYDGYVNRYGPHFWQKVGYVATTVGAMEHATSIHYPISSINGNLQSEDLIAHEMGHSWFGNLVTCKTAGDMWINEGMAEYMSHQYEEDLYGYERYLETVVGNHYYVIRQAHIQDDGYHALTGLSNELTYGDHTYQKGAMVAHNLRGYLGDSLFFSGLTTLLNNNKYGNLDSYDFRDQLAQITGMNLNSFFDDWVFAPGYPDFNIDSMQVITSAIPERTVNIRISQRMLATSKRFTNVPLTLTFYDDQWNTAHYDVMFTNADTIYQLLVPFSPTWATINENNKVLLGITTLDEKINSPTLFSNTKALMNITVSGLTDSAHLRVEHHWTGPSQSGNEPFRLSTARYWRATGILPASFQANARIDYSSSANNAFLDEDLLANGEDSLILVYRKDASEEWAEYPFYTKDVMGSPNNKFGRLLIQNLIAGEYAMANGESSLGISENSQPLQFTLFPNPTTDSITLQFDQLEKQTTWVIRDVKGSIHQQGEFGSKTSGETLSVSNLSPGTYFFSIDNTTVKFVIQ